MKKQNRFRYWLSCHHRAILFSYNELIRSPIASIITICVIAVAMTLPLSFFVVFKNLSFLHAHWKSQAPTISLYVRPNTTRIQAADLVQKLRRNKHIAQATYTTPTQSLKQFETTTQMHDVLKMFHSNPLPGVITVLPTVDYQQPDKINFLFQAIQNDSIIDSAQIDLSWVKRLYYLIQIGNKITHAIALFFGVAVILIISNTLRNVVLRHEKEIEVMQLMGATHGFIRRPLLYFGVISALLGGVLAILLTNMFIWLLDPLVTQLAKTYHSQLGLHILSFNDSIHMLSLCLLLSFFSSWATIQYLLNKL